MGENDLERFMWWVLGIQPRPLCMLGKCSTHRTHLWPLDLPYLVKHNPRGSGHFIPRYLFMPREGRPCFHTKMYTVFIAASLVTSKNLAFV